MSDKQTNLNTVGSKKPYAPPGLISFGALAALTQTGSGDMPESAAMNQCNDSFTKSGNSCG
ncbi:MAG: hypothetical protein AB7U63_06030 [Porticoccaceae bacterium]